jgi:hypothetical protein
MLPAPLQIPWIADTPHASSIPACFVTQLNGLVSRRIMAAFFFPPATPPPKVSSVVSILPFKIKLSYFWLDGVIAECWHLRLCTSAWTIQFGHENMSSATGTAYGLPLPASCQWIGRYSYLPQFGTPVGECGSGVISPPSEFSLVLWSCTPCFFWPLDDPAYTPLGRVDAAIVLAHRLCPHQFDPRKFTVVPLQLLARSLTNRGLIPATGIIGLHNLVLNGYRRPYPAVNHPLCEVDHPPCPVYNLTNEWRYTSNPMHAFKSGTWTWLLPSYYFNIVFSHSKPLTTQASYGAGKLR